MATIKFFPTYFTDEDMPLLEYSNPAGEDAIELKAGISFSNGYNMEIPLRDIPKTAEEYRFEFTEAEKKAIWAATIDVGRSQTYARVYIASLVRKSDGSYEDTLTPYASRSRVEVQDYLPEVDLDLFEVVSGSNSGAVHLTGNAGVIVANVSNVYYDINPTTKKGASISSHLFRNGDYRDASNYSGTIEGTSDPIFHVSLTDSRGYTATKTVDLASEGRWVPYVPLSCSVQHKPLDASGRLRVTIFGKYFSGSFGEVANSFNLSYRATKVGDSNYQWISLGTIADNQLNLDEEGNYTYTFDITGLDYTSQYKLIVKAADAVYERNVYPPTIPAAKILFDWSDEDFAFKIPVSVQGNVNVSGSINATGSITTTAPISTTNSMYINGSTVPSIAGQGTSSNWSYRKWSDGTYECWRTLELSITLRNESIDSWYSSGELTGTNLTFPITFKAKPAVTVTLNPTGNTWAIVVPSNTEGSTTKTGSYQLLATYNHDTNRTYLFSYNVKGRWK